MASGLVAAAVIIKVYAQEMKVNTFQSFQFTSAISLFAKIRSTLYELTVSRLIGVVDLQVSYLELSPARSLFQKN